MARAPSLIHTAWQMRRLAPLLLAAALAAALSPGRARACASCGCGDPTLTVMGREIPFAGRLRASAELRYRADRVGAPGVDAVELHEGRLDLGLSYTPLDRLTLSFTLPLLLRRLSYVNLGWDLGGGVGDLELRARVLLYRDRRLAPRHLLGLHGGLRAPGGPPPAPPPGRTLNPDLLASTGSVDVIAGLSYSHLRERLSLYASAILFVPTQGAFGVRSPLSLRGALSAQYQLRPWIAPQLGVDLRLDGTAYQGEAPDPNSGGFIAYASPGLVLGPAMDWLLYAQLRVPFVQALTGEHREGLIAAVGVTRDF